jgi:hypothetical protein
MFSLDLREKAEYGGAVNNAAHIAEGKTERLVIKEDLWQ